MINTAENIAAEYQLTTEQQHEVALLRAEQYDDATATGFHGRYMQLPFAVPDPRFRREIQQLTGDEGIHPTSAQALASPTLPSVGKQHSRAGRAPPRRCSFQQP